MLSTTSHILPTLKKSDDQIFISSIFPCHHSISLFAQSEDERITVIGDSLSWKGSRW